MTKQQIQNTEQWIKAFVGPETLPRSLKAGAAIRIYLKGSIFFDAIFLGFKSGWTFFGRETKHGYTRGAIEWNESYIEDLGYNAFEEAKKKKAKKSDTTAGDSNTAG